MAKISVKSKRRLCALTIAFFGIMVCLVCTVFKDWGQIMANTRESKELSVKYEMLLQNEVALESEVVKLQDHEYMARYAREKFLYSKNGEVIIKLPDGN